MALFKKLFDKIGDRYEAKTEGKYLDDQAELVKAQALLNIANQPAQKTNPLLIIIPIAVVVIGGVTAYFLLRKKKG
jgi:hypothetical protein